MATIAGPAFDGGEQSALVFLDRLCGVEHNEPSAASASASWLRRMPSCSASSNSFASDLAETRGIDQLNGNAAERDAFGDQIACGAGRRGHDGAVALDEPVEERLLPTLGRPTMASVNPS